jgi:membrane protease YdiL (CAAX protease family)
MNKNEEFSSAVRFSLIVVGLSYLVFWGPIALLRIPTISFVSNVRGPIWAILLFLLGGFVPSTAAILLTAIDEGSQGLMSLWKRCLQFNLGWRWYLAIVGVVVLGAVGQILINSLLGNAFNYSLYLSQLPSFLPLILLGPVSEELGWRGYLLVKLQRRWNALVSSLAVGIVWGLWHLPLFYMVGTSQHELHLPFVGFLLGTLTLSVVMTWVNNNTRNSIWAAILLHWLYTYASQVNSAGITRSGVFNWLEYSPYVLIAIVLMIIWGPRRLSRSRQAALEGVGGGEQIV